MRLYYLLPLSLLFCSLSAQTYRVGPGDLLKISEATHKEEFDDEFRVDNQGNLSLPYLSPLQVQDKTITELQAQITAALMESDLINPQVFIDILEYNYRPISVIGAVKEPGKLKRIGDNVDLIEALTLSGGIQENASNQLFVIRKTPEGLNETLEVNYRELMVEGKYYLNIPLYPGDTVNVPVQKPLLVSVIGEINKPGELSFSRDSKVTILRVIAAAGGFTDYAKRGKILVKRDVNGESKEFPLNVKDIQRNKATDFVMEHNDVVIVP